MTLTIYFIGTLTIHPVIVGIAIAVAAIKIACDYCERTNALKAKQGQII